jgi:hypothetical protein
VLQKCVIGVATPGIGGKHIQSSLVQTHTRRMTMSTTLRMAVAAALLFGTGSATFAASNAGKPGHHRHFPGIDRAAPTFEARDAAAPLPNWGFGCDPDFGPNGYNPCNPVGH